MADIDLKQLYNLLVDTLLLAAPAIDIGDEQLDNCLKELEGDSYTFLHPITLQKLRNANFLNEFQTAEIEDLRNRIIAISPNLWTPEGFKTNNEWQAVRERANDIVTGLRS
ncbi:hypothetical protein [Mucilaginibacter sp. HD30]